MIILERDWLLTDSLDKNVGIKQDKLCWERRVNDYLK